MFSTIQNIDFQSRYEYCFWEPLVDIWVISYKNMALHQCVSSCDKPDYSSSHKQSHKIHI